MFEQNRDLPHRHGWRKLSFAWVSCLVSFCLAVVLISSPLHAQLLHTPKVQLAWDPGPNVAGYKVYYALSSGVYSYVVDVGRVTSCVIGGLQKRRIYFFAVTAYDSSGFETGFPNGVRTHPLSY